MDICSSTSVDTESKAENKSQAITMTPEHSPSPSYSYRQNQVSTVILHGVPIVSLHIDGKERLCLAQISNTLLKQFSYNEIHNRRVALGITCVQCTPVQLEILRRAGAMPISSRRCGMITKREAERLVKSFLEDNRPPKLPDNFYFEVHHRCGWGCKGKFEPSRYNSSRAKCIRCNFCNLYFSPNKFIFHFHRTPDSKYNHPDAANFNSWRRHLHLDPCSENDDISHAWEDVKAMFNGGSRKRMLSSPGFPEPRSSPSENKRPKVSAEEKAISKPNFVSHYQNYPLFSMPGKSYPFSAISAPNPLALQYQINKGELRGEGKQQPSLTFNPWRQHTDYIIPPYDLFWTNQFATARSNCFTGFGKNYLDVTSVKDFTTESHIRQSPTDTHTSSEDEESVSQTFGAERVQNALSAGRPSAFRPVGINEKHNKSFTEKSGSKQANDIESTCQFDLEESDVDIENECQNNDSKDSEKSDVTENRLYSPDTSGSHNNESLVDEEGKKEKVACAETEEKGAISDDDKQDEQLKSEASDSNDQEEDMNSNRQTYISLEEVDNMSKEELQEQLKNEIDIRKQVEGDINKIKRSLQEQVFKEKSQRDEIAKQLQAMKDALCNELEQERKIRFSMQQKLKEAHDALNHFSCKMFNNKPCTDCVVKDTMRQ